MTLPLFNTTLGYGSTGDAVTTLANTPTSPGLFDAGGLFTKLVDTAGQIYITKEQIDASKEATIAAQTKQQQAAEGVPSTMSAQDAMAKVAPYLPYIIGGTFLFIGVIVAVKLARK